MSCIIVTRRPWCETVKPCHFFPLNLVISCFRAQQSERVSREWIKLPHESSYGMGLSILFTVLLALVHHAVHPHNQAPGLMLPPVYQPGLVPSWHVLALITSCILVAQATTNLINSHCLYRVPKAHKTGGSPCCPLVNNAPIGWLMQLKWGLLEILYSWLQHHNFCWQAIFPISMAVVLCPRLSLKFVLTLVN